MGDLLPFSEAYKEIAGDGLLAMYIRATDDLDKCEVFSATDKIRSPVRSQSLLVLPGSFNPLHEGHRWMMTQACIDICGSDRVFDFPCVYELALRRRNKEVLTEGELAKRLTQFRGVGDVFVTNACLFMEKAGLVRGHDACFAIGFDTAKRLIEDHGIMGVQGINAVFLVYDRVVDGQRHTMDDLGPLPHNFKRGTPTPDHIAPISSTAIRATAT